MNQDEETKELLQEVTDRSRSPIVKGKTVLVPLKFGDSGDLLNSQTFDARKHFKKLDLNDLRFLKCWRDNAWDTEKTCADLFVESAKVKKLVAKLEVFREEDARTKALAAIPTAAWVSARHVENIYQGGVLEDSERDSLKELAKITGAYKTAATVNIHTNIFQMPQLSPEAMAKLKEFADSQADIVETELA